MKDPVNYIFFLEGLGGGPKNSGSEQLQIFRNNLGPIRLFTQYKKPGKHYVS